MSAPGGDIGGPSVTLAKMVNIMDQGEIPSHLTRTNHYDIPVFNYPRNALLSTEDDNFSSRLPAMKLTEH